MTIFTKLFLNTTFKTSLLGATLSASLSIAPAHAETGVTETLMNQVIKTFDESYGIEAKVDSLDGSLCNESGYCIAYFNGFKVSVWGKGIAEVETTSLKPHEDYRFTCAALYGAIACIDPNLAAEIIGTAFLEAAQSEDGVKGDVEGVEITIKPDFSKLLKCEFFKW